MKVQTTCSFCATGCSLEFEVDENKILSCKPVADYPVNKGLACIKGKNLAYQNSMEHRVTTPLLRDENGKMNPISWEEAYEIIVKKFKDINEKYGEGSLAFLSTGQIPLEEMALLGYVGRFGMGMEGDGNTRLCMATAAVAYNQSFGFDSPPYSWDDLMTTDLAIFIGANPAISHPVPWWRFRKENKNVELVVIDPRKTETANCAKTWISIKPKGDLYFLYALANYLIEEEYVDEKFAKENLNNFDEFKKFVKDYTLDGLREKCGIDKKVLIDLGEEIYKKDKVSFWWTMGVNQSFEATRTAEAITNICLLMKKIGKKGCGPNSLTGQCNAMGSRLYSAETCLFAGRKFDSEKDREFISNVLEIEKELIPKRATLAFNQIIEKVETKDIRGLWVIATNPVVSYPHNTTMENFNSKIDFLVVQDIYSDTETAKEADLFLPSATSLEKEGTFINTERRLGSVQKVVEPPEGIKSDYEIILEIGKVLGLDEKLKLDNWKTPENAFNLMKKISEGMPCDITGVDYEKLKNSSGIQWPFKKDEILENDYRILFEDYNFYTENKKANLIFEKPQECPEIPDEKYPFTLITGRGAIGLWHTLTRTRNIPIVQHTYPNEDYILINKDDAEKLNLKDEDMVLVTSKNGSCNIKVKISDEMLKGQVFVSMHYEVANRLTDALYDPYSKEPSYKYATVSIKKV
ncbi:molybdopterin oxidoreductase family protein (plasmid) [Cetobacterium somerae]|uniref:molybdopterin oxidoreductase family protein n=1 Tax=Cetobacterium somerae TaxID=188913 RepID=UPI003D769EB7